ncbi:MAG: TonB-dependent receptor [Wenzhouxiangellaceae bacterium]
MVERVPGFTIDDGDGSRGFGGAAGNLLINGERPSIKQDTASQILERIPASQVQRIDLIRGQGGGLDLRGQAVAVNVILSKQTATAYTWEVVVEQDTDSGGPTPTGTLSMNDRWGETQYTLAAEARQFFFGNPAEEILIIGDTDSERRDEYERTKGHGFDLNLNSESQWGGSVVHFNAEIGYETRRFIERSSRFPLVTQRQFTQVDQDSDTDIFNLELGGDSEWLLSDHWIAKVIALHRQQEQDAVSSVVTRDVAEQLLSGSSADTESHSSESIARLEFDWTGWSRHTLEFDIEGTFNVLDNQLRLVNDAGDGSGPQPVDVPGANTRVEELRGDIRLADSWRLDHWVMETALGAEISDLSVSGDSDNQRDFFFMKPSWTLTYAPNQQRQTRLRLLREVAQLDFANFVSATNFNDQDFDLGNAELGPDRTWVAEFSHEHRFGDLGVVTLTLFHNWVEEVQDLLPAGGIFEVPGNIGNGRRWGAELETTLPLQPLGIQGGRLDIDARWQDSSVTDPVTGRKRVFSLEREFEIFFRFRQDLQAERWAWGWNIEMLAESPFFGVDELDLEDRGVDFELFIETTRWWGVKMNLTVQNVGNREFVRDRRVFSGQRDLSPLAFRELRDRRRDRSILFTVSGSF